MKRVFLPTLWFFTAFTTVFLIITGYNFYFEVLTLFASDNEASNITAACLSVSIELAKMISTHLAMIYILKGMMPRIGYIIPSIIFLSLSFVAHYINTRSIKTNDDLVNKDSVAMVYKLPTNPLEDESMKDAPQWRKTQLYNNYIAELKLVKETHQLNAQSNKEHSKKAEDEKQKYLSKKLEEKKKAFYLVLLFEIIQLLLIISIVDLSIKKEIHQQSQSQI